jgi:hypothetical protein
MYADQGGRWAPCGPPTGCKRSTAICCGSATSALDLPYNAKAKPMPQEIPPPARSRASAGAHGARAAQRVTCGGWRGCGGAGMCLGQWPPPARRSSLPCPAAGRRLVHGEVGQGWRAAPNQAPACAQGRAGQPRGASTFSSNRGRGRRPARPEAGRGRAGCPISPAAGQTRPPLYPNAGRGRAGRPQVQPQG